MGLRSLLYEMVHSPVTLPDIHSVFFSSFFSPPTPFLLFFLFFLLGKLFCSFSLTHLASFHNSFNRGMSHICRPAPRGWCDRNDQLRHYHTYGSSSSCPCVVLQHTSLSMGTYICKLQNASIYVLMSTFAHEQRTWAHCLSEYKLLHANTYPPTTAHKR